MMRLGPLPAVLLLCACASHPKMPAPPPPPPSAALPASYDFHVLVVAPFGSVFKTVPFALHEVLLFKDEAQAASAEEADCYGMDEAAPRFMEQPAQALLLCFRHDHLMRIEASVALPAPQASRMFGDACGLWGGQPELFAAQAGNAAEVCRGRNGAVEFYATLERDAAAESTEVPLTIKLDDRDPP